MAFSLRGFLTIGCVWVVSVFIGACNNDGTTPPVGRLNFPTAIAIDGNNLFVANSNFTLRFNEGSLHRYDLAVVNARLVAQCNDKPLADRDACGIIPSEDSQSQDIEETLDVSVESGILTSEVFLGSFAAGISVAPTAEGTRVYLPVRSDADITFVDVDERGAMNCGDRGGFESSLVAGGQRHTCADDFREGDQMLAAERDISLPTDPVALASGPLSDIGGTGSGNYVITAHRGGRVSFFIEDEMGPPFLVNVLEGLPTELVAITLDPRLPQLWLPNAVQPQISRVGVALDENLRDISRSFLFDVGGIPLVGVDTGAGPGMGAGDTRALRFDPRPDVNRAYILSRLPNALLSVDLSEGGDVLEVRDIMEVGLGPSRLEVRYFETFERTLAFVSCFNSQDVYVLDVDQARLAGIVRGLGGAFELATFSDENMSLLYVLDFQASLFRVLDLNPMFDCLNDNVGSTDRECSPQVLGFVGVPQTRRELI